MSVPYKWVSCSTSLLPSGLPLGAVHAGRDVDGAAVYVGRAPHLGDVIPAKVIPSKNACYVAHNGVEVLKHDFEVLVPSTLSWKAASHGAVPACAVPAGATAAGETLYVGRATHDGCATPGKIHPSHGTCYYPFGGEEHSSEVYECLVIE